MPKCTVQPTGYTIMSFLLNQVAVLIAYDKAVRQALAHAAA